MGQWLVSSGYPRWQLFLPTLTAICIAAAAFYFLPTPQQQRQQSPASSLPVAPASAVPHNAPASSPPSSASSPSPSSLLSTSSSPSVPIFDARRVVAMGLLPFCSDLLRHLTSQYRHRTVFLFSLYVVWGNSVLELLLNYDLSLWYSLDPTFDYNGVVLALGWLLSAAAAFLTSRASVVTFVSLHPLWVLTALPALSALLVWASTWTDSVWVACALFVSFYAVLSFLMVVSSALIASSMSFTAFALLFSVNTFASLAVQTAVQLTIGEWGWALTIQGKYRVFGTQLLVLSLFYAAVGAKRAMQDTVERATRQL